MSTQTHQVIYAISLEDASVGGVEWRYKRADRDELLRTGVAGYELDQLVPFELRVPVGIRNEVITRLVDEAVWCKHPALMRISPEQEGLRVKCIDDVLAEVAQRFGIVIQHDGNDNWWYQVDTSGYVPLSQNLLQTLQDTRGKHFVDNSADGMYRWDERCEETLAILEDTP